jgi:predicted Na+-dependent transporter
MYSNKLKVCLSLFSIITLFFDYFITDEFNIEGAYLYLLVFLLVFSMYFTIKKPQFRIVLLILKLVLTGFLLYNIGILGIFLFGVGFTGRDFPIILAVAIILNIWFLAIFIIEVGAYLTRETDLNRKK